MALNIPIVKNIFKRSSELGLGFSKKIDEEDTGDEIRYEFYSPEGNGDSNTEADGNDWPTQTFTIGNTGENEDMNLSRIKLFLYREGSPGTFTVTIRNIDVNGKPKGDDLCSSILDGNALTDNAAGEEKILTMSPIIKLLASTKYAIVLKALDGDATNSVHAKIDNTTGTYGGGDWGESNDAGVTWTLGGTSDVVFEIFGTKA